MSPQPDQRRTLSYLRLPRAARRRRARPVLAVLRRLALALVWLSPVGALAIWLTTAPGFALTKVEVRGGTRVEDVWVQQQASGVIGQNLLLLELGDLQGRLADHPWVRAVELRKRLPDGLLVRLHEYAPAAVLERSDGRWFLASDGVVIAPWSALDEAPELLIRCCPDVAEPLVGEHLRRALALADQLAASDTAWASRPLGIEVLGERDFAVDLAEQEFRMVVDPVRVAAMVETLDRLLPDLRRRYPRLERVDLRFDRRVVVKPAQSPESLRDPTAADGAFPMHREG